MVFCDSLIEPALPIEGADRRFICALQDLKNAVDSLAHLLGIADGNPEGRWLPANGEDPGQICAVAHALAGLARVMMGGSEDERVGGPGSHMSLTDLPRLVQTRMRLRVLRTACDTLVPLIRAQVSQRSRRTESPERTSGIDANSPDALSITAADAHLAAVLAHVDRMLVTLQRAIRAATSQQDSRILWTAARFRRPAGRHDSEKRRTDVIAPDVHRSDSALRKHGQPT